MKVSGIFKLSIVMERVSKFIVMVVYMKVTISKIKQMAVDVLFMQMVTFMMVNGKMTRLMGMGNISTLMELSMLDIGLTISSTVKVKRSGLMVLNMKETTNMERSMAEESSYGLIGHHTMVNSLIIIYMVLVNTGGLMEENSKEIGYVIRCMEEECLPGQTVEDMRETTMMTRSRVMESSCGQMEGSMMANG